MKPRWSENLVLICEKCGKKLQTSPAIPNPAADLKDWLKKELIKRSLWGPNRTVITSCLDICPDGKIAVAFMSDRPDLEAWAETVTVEERQRILQIVVERAKSKPPELPSN